MFYLKIIKIIDCFQIGYGNTINMKNAVFYILAALTFSLSQTYGAEAQMPDPPPIFTGKEWTVTIHRRKCVYRGGNDFPDCNYETILWLGKLTRRGKSFDFDAVWRNQETSEEVRDKVVLIDAVRERVVFRRDGEEKENLSKFFKGSYEKETPTRITGNYNRSEIFWKAKIETDSLPESWEVTFNEESGRYHQLRKKFTINSDGQIIYLNKKTPVVGQISDESSTELSVLIKKLNLSQAEASQQSFNECIGSLHAPIKSFILKLNSQTYEMTHCNGWNWKKDFENLTEEKKKILGSPQKYEFTLDLSENQKETYKQLLQKAEYVSFQNGSARTKKFKSWEINSGRSGGIAGFIEAASIDSNGNLKKRNGSTEKIEETKLTEIFDLISQLNLPKAKTKIVKGEHIYDGIYSGFSITLDGEVYQLRGNSFYDEKQVILTKRQSKTLQLLEAKLTEIGF